LFAPRLTLTLISPCRVLAVWRRWQPLAWRRNTSTQLCRLTMISSRSRSRPWVLSMSRPLLFCTKIFHGWDASVAKTFDFVSDTDPDPDLGIINGILFNLHDREFVKTLRPAYK